MSRELIIDNDIFSLIESRKKAEDIYKDLTKIKNNAFCLASSKISKKVKRMCDNYEYTN